jgi:hypothetical protein
MSFDGSMLYRYNLASSRCRDGVQLLGRPAFPATLPAELDVVAGYGDELLDAGRVDAVLLCDISGGLIAQ